jgi:hypothetical protein
MFILLEKYSLKVKYVISVGAFLARKANERQSGSKLARFADHMSHRHLIGAEPKQEFSGDIV